MTWNEFKAAVDEKLAAQDTDSDIQLQIRADVANWDDVHWMDLRFVRVSVEENIATVHLSETGLGF